MLRATGGIQPLQTLFSTLKFEIPDFQRNYAWEDEQIDEFWNDLEYTINRPNASHFIGSVILLNDGREERARVIDGQQRMTTIVMTLGLLRDLIVKNGQQVLIPNAQGAMPVNVLFQVQSLLFADGLPRFEANPVLKQRFLDCVIRDLAEDPSRDHFKKNEQSDSLKLRKAYWLLESHIGSHVDKHGGLDSENRLKSIYEVVRALTQRMVLLRIDCEEQHEAIAVYMTLNNRGLGLTPADLLKSMIMKHLGAHVSGDALKAINTTTVEAWNQMIDNVGDQKLNQFLRHYLLVHFPIKESIREKDIFRLFEQLIEGETPLSDVQIRANTETVFQDIQRAARLYGQLIDPEPTTFSKPTKFKIRCLNDLLDSHRVFLLAALQASLKDPAVDFDEMVTLADVTAVRWLVAGMNAQVLENLFQAMARKVLNRDLAPIERVEAVRAEAQSASPTDDILRNRLSESGFSIPIARTVLIRINESLTHYMGIVDYAAQKVNVEHIAPLTPSTYWYSAIGISESSETALVQYKENVSRLGNLTLLEYKLNSSIKNAEWSLKRFGIPGKQDKSYADTILRVAADVRESVVWNARLIAQRADWIASCFFSIWNFEGEAQIANWSAPGTEGTEVTGSPLGSKVPVGTFEQLANPSNASTDTLTPLEELEPTDFDLELESMLEAVDDTDPDEELTDEGLPETPCHGVPVAQDDQGNSWCPICGAPVTVLAMAGFGCPNCGSKDINTSGHCENCQALVIHKSLDQDR